LAQTLCGTTSKLGVVTSKKIGNAVARTRARRLLREFFGAINTTFPNPANWCWWREIPLPAKILPRGKRFSECLRESNLLKAESATPSSTS
jgi:hypothetical protein